MTVLEELDHVKDRPHKAVSREARIAIQALERLLVDASPAAIQDGVPIPHSAASGATGALSIFQDQRVAGSFWDRVPTVQTQGSAA